MVNLLRNRVVTLDRFSWSVCSDLPGHFKTIFGGQFVRFFQPIQGNPFRIEEPNGIRLRDWTIDSVSYGHRGRYEIFKVLTNYSTLSRLTHASWVHGEEPINGSFEKVTDSTYLSESENTFKIRTSAGISVPKIFQMKSSVGYDISYTTEVRHTVKFGSEIQLKLNINQSVAPYLHNPQSLNMDLYLFSPEDGIDYWYWDSIPNTSQRPWYIAYVVKGASKSIALQAPPDHYVLEGRMPEFYWQTEGMDKDASCSMFIASGWPISPGNVLYEETTGGRTASFVSGFVPEPGKTYYWAVRGVDGPGEITWSDPRTFTVAKDDPVATEQAGLMAIVYPNPSPGQGIHVNMLGAAGNDVRVSLYSMEGTLICAGQYDGTGPGETDVLLPCFGLAPGIYLVEITTLRERLVKKLVVI